MKIHTKIFLLSILLALLFSPAFSQNTSVGNSPTFIARFDQPANAANIPSTLVFSTSSKGMYRATCYIEITQAATTSSVMPACVVGWTTADSNVAQTAQLASISGANTVGTNSAQNNVGMVVIQVATSTNITLNTNGYASSGATPMQYVVHFKLEFIGS